MALSKKLAVGLLAVLVMLTPALPALAAEDTPLTEPVGETTLSNDGQGSSGVPSQPAQQKDGTGSEGESDDTPLSGEESTPLSSSSPPPTAPFDEVFNVGAQPLPRQLEIKPDTQTGALAFGYPITLPPGRNGLQPDLSLNYNSQGLERGNMVGLGWSLSIPYIKRIARKGVDKLYDNNYFYSSLSGEIVPVSLTDSTHGTYRAEVHNGSFLKYDFNTSDQWIVQDKQGTKYSFGLTSQSRQTNPVGTAKTYRWLVEEIRDRNDNFIKFEYSKSDNQIYPGKITYTGHGSTNGIFVVDFVTETRPDTSRMYNSGFSVTTTKRVKEIKVTTDGNLTRKYDLAYTSGVNGTDSLLHTITETGYDKDSVATALPVTKFDYSKIGSKKWQWDTTYVVPHAFINLQKDYGARLADVNGDGLVDFMLATDSGITSQVDLNKGDGTGWKTDSSYSIPNTFIGFNSEDRGVRPTDINGDGLVDLLKAEGSVTSTEYRQVNINKGDGTGWRVDTVPYIPHIFVGNNGRDRGIRLSDVNADGLVDVLQGENTDFQMNINKGDGTGWQVAAGYTITHAFVNLHHDYGSRLADINSDGLPDFLLATKPGTASQVDLNKGDSTGWEQVSNYTIPVFFIDSHFDQGVRILDVNADGLPDLVKGDGVRQEVYINEGYGAPSSGWKMDSTYTLPIKFINAGGRDAGVRAADINGDGLVDLIKGEDSRLEAYINKGNVPNLLTTITDSKGAKTFVGYKSSANYLVDGKLANPKVSHPIQTVNTVAVDDGYGNVATTTYAYKDGFYYYSNPLDRKFAGFGMVTTIDPLGNEKKEYFHQGDGSSTTLGEYLDSKAKINLVYREELYDGSSNLYSQTINKWDKTTLATADSSFVYRLETLTQDFDGNATHKDKATSFAYDTTTGNLTTKTDWGEVNGNNDGTFTDIGNDKYITTISYATDTGSNNLIGLPKQETVTNQLGQKVRESKHYYDSLAWGSVSKGNQTQQDDWISGTDYAVNKKTYNSHGLVSSETDANNHTTNYSFDSHNLYPATATNPLSQVTSYQYDYSAGKPTQITDVNNHNFTISYDGLDRVTEEKQPDNSDPLTLVTKTAYVYTDTFPNNVQTSNYLDTSIVRDRYDYFDGLGRLVQQRQEAEASNTFSVRDRVYDERGQLSKTSLPYFSTGSGRTAATTDADLYTEFTYDPLGRPLTVTNAVGTTSNSYDDWTVTTVDANSNQKKLYRDAYNQLIQVDEHEGSSVYQTNYEYNGNGKLTEITDALGNIRGFAYDGLGRRTTAQDLHQPADATFSTWAYDYDNAGNLIRQTDGEGQVIEFDYDEINRLKSEDFTGAAGLEIEYAYDSCTNGTGRLCQTRTDSVITDYSYNPNGQVIWEQRDIASQAFVTEQAYDRQGNLTTLRYPDAAEANYNYNSAGQLEEVVGIVNNLDYAPTGLVEAIDYDNGITTVNTYDASALYRLSNRTTIDGASNKWQDITYTYDNVGNITDINDVSSTGAAKVASYTYDDLYRLKTAVITPAGASSYTLSYSYDAIGNLTSQTGLGSYLYESTNHANPHAVTKIGATTYSYDKNGNFTGDGTDSLDWNFKNQLEAYNTPSKTYGYGYDHAGQRVTKLDGGAVTDRYPNRYYETDGTKDIKHVYAGDLLVASLESTATTSAAYFVHTDHLSGSNVTTDSTGAVAQVLDYDPFGTIRVNLKPAGSDQTHKFTGYELDEETDLYYAGQRYYNGPVARFVSLDPAHLMVGEDEGFKERFDRSLEFHLSNPQSLNSYSYVNNNPLKYVDEEGEMLEEFAEDQRAIANFLHNAGTFTQQQGGLMNSAAGFVANALGDVVKNIANVYDPSQETGTRLWALGLTALDVSTGGGKSKAVNKSVQGAKRALTTWPGPNNGRQTINGIRYTVHALERMAPRGLAFHPFKKGELYGKGIPPSVVENAIKHGKKVANDSKTIKSIYDNIGVITNKALNRVITVFKTKSKRHSI